MDSDSCGKEGESYYGIHNTMLQNQISVGWNHVLILIMASLETSLKLVSIIPLFIFQHSRIPFYVEHKCSPFKQAYRVLPKIFFATISFNLRESLKLSYRRTVTRLGEEATFSKYQLCRLMVEPSSGFSPSEHLISFSLQCPQPSLVSSPWYCHTITFQHLTCIKQTHNF